MPPPPPRARPPAYSVAAQMARLHKLGRAHSHEGVTGYYHTDPEEDGAHSFFENFWSDQADPIWFPALIWLIPVTIRFYAQHSLMYKHTRAMLPECELLVIGLKRSELPKIYLRCELIRPSAICCWTRFRCCSVRALALFVFAVTTRYCPSADGIPMDGWHRFVVKGYVLQVISQKKKKVKNLT